MAADSIKPINLAVLLSGAGSTLANFLECIAAGKLDARISVVVSSRPGVRGLEIAEAAGIPTRVVSRKKHPDEREFSKIVDAALDEFPVDLVVFAGFMSKYFAAPKYFGKIINIHPALIPMFCGRGYYGHHVHEAVLSRGVKVTGCTVHFVDDEYDHGPIIAQRAVPVRDDDTPDTLAARVQAEERKLYPQVIQWFAEGRVTLEHGRAIVKGRDRTEFFRADGASE
jgi:formyltetrahydrofolate-dependent phosphoribosylglycinamide formyltransferase